MVSPAEAGPRTSRRRLLLAAASIGAALGLLGCAAPGEPSPRHPVVPEAVSDLAARQSGDAVVLTFTLPRDSTEREPLAEPPAVEIYRRTSAPGAPGAPAQAAATSRLIYTIPSGMVNNYLSEGRVRFTDSIPADELARQAGAEMEYIVRTRVSKRRASADSNVAALRVYPAPGPPLDVRAVLTEQAIELSWSPPEGSAPSYRVYRAEIAAAEAAAATEKLEKAKLAPPLELLGSTTATAYRDTRFEFGRTYLYVVRSAAQYGADSVESADSQPLAVAPRDIFPPAAPQHLQAVVIPASLQSPAHIELTWAINSEPDLAGYNVYRSAQPDTFGQRLNSELLPSPEFRDISVEVGKQFFYWVTAVDRAGNESPRSTVVSAEVPASAP